VRCLRTARRSVGGWVAQAAIFKRQFLTKGNCCITPRWKKPAKIARHEKPIDRDDQPARALREPASRTMKHCRSSLELGCLTDQGGKAALG
jgi:hypothetical protein